jgi:hypothetical protein
MATKAYTDGRKYGSSGRPEGAIFSNLLPISDGNGGYLPDGYEFGSTQNNTGDFIILSDHNRASMNFASQRIENRQRMVNGRMRSYWVADKMTLEISWSMLPSRAFNKKANFDPTTGKPGTLTNYPKLDSDLTKYTVDGGAGGAELLDWYENHYGTFYVLLSYDKYPAFTDGTGPTYKNDASFGHLKQYNEYMEMYIADFTYSVEKRGATNYDMWNVSIKLEEA